MYILILFMIIGILLNYRNLNGDKILTKYEGITITIISLLVFSSIDILIDNFNLN